MADQTTREQVTLLIEAAYWFGRGDANEGFPEPTNAGEVVSKLIRFLDQPEIVAALVATGLKAPAVTGGQHG